MMTPARYPMPPIPDVSVVMADTLDVTSPAGPAGESLVGDKSLLAQMSPSGSVAQASVSPTSPAISTPDVSPSSETAAMDQHLPWNGVAACGRVCGLSFASLLPAPLTPRRMGPSSQTG